MRQIYMFAWQNGHIRNCQSWSLITVHFNPIDYDYFARWQSDPGNTKERPHHKPSQDLRKSTALGGAWDFAERCIVNICKNDVHIGNLQSIHWLIIISVNLFYTYMQNYRLWVYRGSYDLLVVCFNAWVVLNAEKNII